MWVRLAELPAVSVARMVQSPPVAPGTLATHVWLNTVAWAVRLGHPAPLTCEHNADAVRTVLGAVWCAPSKALVHASAVCCVLCRVLCAVCCALSKALVHASAVCGVLCSFKGTSSRQCCVLCGVLLNQRHYFFTPVLCAVWCAPSKANALTSAPCDSKARWVRHLSHLAVQPVLNSTPQRYLSPHRSCNCQTHIGSEVARTRGMGLSSHALG